MKRLPVKQPAGGNTSGQVLSAPPTACSSPSDPAPPSAAIPSSSCQLPRIYPWLLILSTAIAALFCLLYITKPIILSSSAPNHIPSLPFLQTDPAIPAIPSLTADPADLTPSSAGGSTTQAGLMPDGDRLPGEPNPASAGNKRSASSHAWPVPSAISGFEETNLRIQHILTAEAPGGHRARIDLDVPVLYQSRNLRWTPADVQEARKILARLMDYQEKSLHLRAEGSELLLAWNRLIGHSLPATELRADSPSLPANQEDAADAPRPADLITTESIKIQPAAK
ncbi:MAG: hypothetical protein NTV46_19550 [Verrucomicrobia bacterium]|nr:hypothetical protein [Verrucomicrobiota bacterium]